MCYVVPKAKKPCTLGKGFYSNGRLFWGILIALRESGRGSPGCESGAFRRRLHALPFPKEPGCNL
jgi:hypothetical protein